MLSPLAADQAFAVGAEGHAVDLAGVPLEGESFLAGLGVPHLDGVVLAAADQAFAVGAEGHAEDPAGVPFEGKDFLAGLGVPHLEGAVIAAAG